MNVVYHNKQKEVKMAYKIVTHGLKSGGLSINSRLSVQYKRGKWVRPKIGPSFVFKRLEDAIKGLPLICGRGVIWRCRTINLRLGVNMVAPGGLGHLIKEIAKFWKGEEVDLDSYNPIVPVLQGTYLADKVMLTKRVR